MSRLYYFLSCLLLLLAGACLPLRGTAQPAALPPDFYALYTPAAQVAFLRKAIGDSVAKSAYTNVPAWCHTGLALARQLPGNDTLSPWFYQYLGDAYDASQPDSAAIYYRRSLESFRNPGIIKNVYLLQSLLYDYLALDNRDSIILYTQQLARTVQPLPDTARIKLKSLNTVASAYGALSQYAKAIALYQSIIPAALRIRDTGVLRNAFVNAGSACNQAGDDAAALYYTVQAIPYLAGAGPADCIAVYGNLSDYYSIAGHTDSARTYLQRAEALAAASGDTAAIAFTWLRRAGMLLNERAYAAAGPVLAKALEYYRRQPPDVNLVNAWLLTSALDTGLHQYRRAEANLQQLYALTRQMNNSAYRLIALRMLCAVAAKEQRYQEAFVYQAQSIALNDSINTEMTRERFAALQAQYETLQKEEQITGLQKQSRIQELELKTAHRNKAILLIIALSGLCAATTLVYIRTLRSRTAMKQLAAGLEMKALRSQMNPHFIFNSLNSIQKYIWENRQEDAAEYLIQFARLIRLVLENSQHPSVPLADELAALRIYIELEHRRSGQQFDYSISVAPDVDATAISVPPLLLQPYVENAIWHGLSAKEDRGELRITITRRGSLILCTIADNGVGRARTAAGKASGVAQKTSLAMNISSQRVAYLQEAGQPGAAVEIVDEYRDAVAAGTTVLLTLPLSQPCSTASS